MKLILVAVAVTAGCGSKDEPEPAPAAVQAPTPAPAAPAPLAPPTPEREPTFVASSKESGMAYRNEKEQAAAVKLEDIAVRRVFEKCSHLPAWRGGPTLKGNLVYKGKAKVERVNVSVNLADAADARGNMLPYMITFDAKKTPVVIQATKDIAATLCSLEASNTDYPL